MRIRTMAETQIGIQSVLLSFCELSLSWAPYQLAHHSVVYPTVTQFRDDRSIATNASVIRAPSECNDTYDNISQSSMSIRSTASAAPLHHSMRYSSHLWLSPFRMLFRPFWPILRTCKWRDLDTHQLSKYAHPFLCLRCSFHFPHFHRFFHYTFLSFPSFFFFSSH